MAKRAQSIGTIIETQALSAACDGSVRFIRIASRAAGNHLARKRRIVQKFRAIAAQIGDKPHQFR